MVAQCIDPPATGRELAPARPGSGVRSISVGAPKENAAARVPPPENASPTITSSEAVVLSRPTTSAAAELSASRWGGQLVSAI